MDFVGLRDWQAGDRLSSIDWPQSTLTNFTPLVVRDYEQPGTAPIVVVADLSPSTRCGITGTPIAAGVARAMATIGLSAVYFQDMFGIITFDKGFASMAAVRPRVGRGHVIHCLDAYQGRVGMEEVRAGQRLATTIGGHLRRTTLLPVISDFLFEDAPERIKEIAELNSVHDVFLVMMTARVRRSCRTLRRVDQRLRSRNGRDPVDVATRAAQSAGASYLADDLETSGARSRHRCVAAERRQAKSLPARWN